LGKLIHLDLCSSRYRASFGTHDAPTRLETTPMLLGQLLLLVSTMLPVPQEQRYSLSVDVELVQVSANVVDESGSYIEGLTPDDFQVLENGQEQKISFFSHDAGVPVSLGVLVDVSGSHQEKLEQGLKTVSEVAASLADNDEMFIVTFNSRVDLRQKFTGNKEEIQSALRNIRAHGETAVYDAISLGLDEMKTARHRKQILLLVTDCFDTRSKIKPDQVEDLIRDSNVQVYAIGIDDDDLTSNKRKGPRYRIYDYMLNRLTSAGGGRLIRMSAGRDYDLRQLAQTVLGELHQQYTMGYYPAAGPEKEGFRSIEVRVVKPGTRKSGEKLRIVRRDPAE